MENIVIPMNFNTEKKKPTYDEMAKIECPYVALGNRVIVVHIDKEDSKKKKSGLFIPEHVQKSMDAAENFIVPGIVMAIGKDSGASSSDFDISPDLEVNDIVYTYPGGFEAKQTVGDISYLIFAKRDILMKLK